MHTINISYLILWNQKTRERKSDNEKSNKDLPK